LVEGETMTWYNMTGITESASGGVGVLFQINAATDGWLAYGFVIMITAIILIVMLNKNYDYYSTLLTSSFVSAISLLLFRLIIVDGVGMVTTQWVIVAWVLFAVFGMLKVMVGGKS